MSALFEWRACPLQGEGQRRRWYGTSMTAVFGRKKRVPFNRSAV
jgi:hypothetical protein